MIPDQGTLNETAPTRLMLSLFEQSQTGILYLRQNEILKVFYLNRGKISWAISSDDSDRLDHILLARKLVASEVLAPFQAGNKISESFGKVLVENGILTLDGLIQATREQVRHISFSVMRWNSGSYQLVQESPPNRLVSLDIDISSIVAQYVLGQMDVNIVWEEMGSFSGEMQQDPGKMRMYSLDAEQQDVLARFSVPRRLDSVLLDFPAERKHRILKFLYFFLLTGLLKKQEVEKGTHIDFKELDSLFGQSLENAPDEVDIEMPAMIDETAIQDIPLGEMPEITMEKETSLAEPELPELPDLVPDETLEAKEAVIEPQAERQETRERPRPQPFLRQEKQKSRWLSVPVLSLLLVAALLGAFLWLSRGSDQPTEETAQPAAAKAQPGETVAGNEAAAAEMSETAAAPDEAGAEQEAGPALEPLATPPAAALEAAAAEKDPVANAAASTDEARAWKYFAAGNFRTAGDIWRGVMQEAKITFSILLEMDCQKASVRSAYRQVTDPEGFFLLNRTRNDGRNCWLVLWGRFRTADEASLAIKLVPEYFLKQSHPPSVIELGPYLN